MKAWMKVAIGVHDSGCGSWGGDLRGGEYGIHDLIRNATILTARMERLRRATSLLRMGKSRRWGLP